MKRIRGRVHNLGVPSSIFGLSAILNPCDHWSWRAFFCFSCSRFVYGHFFQLNKVLRLKNKCEIILKVMSIESFFIFGEKLQEWTIIALIVERP